MTRLAYVCADPGVPIFGAKGCSIHVQEMVRAFEREGVSVEIFAARRGGEPAPDLRHVPVHGIARPAKLPVAARERALRCASATAADELEKLGPFDVVYERYSLWSCAVLERARQRRWPSILEVNAPLPDEQRRHRELSDVAGAERIARRALSAAATRIAVSEPTARWAASRAAGRPVLTVPNGVDIARFAQPPTKGRNRRHFTIGFVGSLKPWHGARVLVEAFKSLARTDDRYRLVVAGEGPELAGVRGALEHAGLHGRARLLGAVPHSDIPRILAGFDVATAPYVDEGDGYFSPLKIVEYLAAGRPVVASSTGFEDPIVVDGVTALLSPPGDAAALASRIAALLADPLLAQRLGQNGRAAAARTRSWRSVARRVLALAATL